MPSAELNLSPIEAYLADIAARLPGPRRCRRAIMEELRDGLQAATDVHRNRGLTPEAAVRAALTEFGEPHTVAAAFAEELATAHARGTSLTYLLTGPMVGISWLLLLAPAHWWRQGPSALWTSIPALPIVAASCGTGLLVLGGTGRLNRWLHIGPHYLLDMTILLAVACMAGDLLVLVTLARASPPMLSGSTGAVVVIAIMASLTRLACSAVAVLRCQRTRRLLVGLSC